MPAAAAAPASEPSGNGIGHPAQVASSGILHLAGSASLEELQRAGGTGFTGAQRVPAGGQPDLLRVLYDPRKAPDGCRPGAGVVYVCAYGRAKSSPRGQPCRSRAPSHQQHTIRGSSLQSLLCEQKCPRTGHSWQRSAWFLSPLSTCRSASSAEVSRTSREGGQQSLMTEMFRHMNQERGGREGRERNIAKTHKGG